MQSVARIPSGQAQLVRRSERQSSARELNSSGPVLVERVRMTGVGKPDKWRKP